MDRILHLHHRIGKRTSRTGTRLRIDGLCDLPARISERKAEYAVNPALVILRVGRESLPYFRYKVCVLLHRFAVVRQPIQHLNIFRFRAAEKLLRRVDAEPVYTHIQPIFHDILKFPAQIFICKIHVRHTAPKRALIPIIRTSNPVPARCPVFSFFDIIVIHIRADQRIRLLPRFQTADIIIHLAEPFMLTRCMVDGKVYNHLDPSLITLRQKLLEILDCPIFLINAVIIHRIVFVVRCGLHQRHEPDPGKPKLCYVVKLGDHTLKVTDPVPVTITERINKNLIIRAVIIVNQIYIAIVNFVFILPAARRKKTSACHHRRECNRRSPPAKPKFLHKSLTFRRTQHQLVKYSSHPKLTALYPK